MTKSPPLIDIWQFIAYAVCTIAYPKIMNTTPDMAVKIGSLFFVFNTPDGKVKVPSGYSVSRIYFTDGLFREYKGSANYPIKKPMLDSFIKYENSELTPKDKTISGLGFIADLVPEQK